MQNSENHVDDPFLKTLAWGFINRVESYPVYFVNGCCFHTSARAQNRKTNNSGVVLSGEQSDYHGVIQDIIVIEYPGLPIKRLSIFNCKWFDPTPTGTRICRKYGIVEVKSTRRYNGKDTFIFAQQAEQAYFTPWPNPNSDRKNWFSVIKTKSRRTIQSPDAPFQDDVNLGTNDLSCLQEFNVTLRDFTLAGEEINPNDTIPRVDCSNDDVEEEEAYTSDSSEDANDA